MEALSIATEISVSTICVWGGSTPLQAKRDVPLDGVAFSRLE